MIRFSYELLVYDRRALCRATAIVAILFTFNVMTTDAQQPEFPELQPASHTLSPGSSSSLLMDDRIFDNAEENVLNSTQIYYTTDSTIKMSTYNHILLHQVKMQK